MTNKLSRGSLAALLAAAGPNARLTATKAEVQELVLAGLATPAGNLTTTGKMLRRSVFLEMEDQAFGAPGAALSRPQPH